MEELRRIAMASYHASSSQLQKLGHDFFDSMDHDGNRKIDQREFLEFMREAGHNKMSNMYFFNQLDINKDGHLDFTEVMMVYYIIQSGRPFCDCCNRFVTSTYLTCVTCLEDPNACPYYLCLDCYAHPRFDHLHDRTSQFVDNYSLLEYLTKSKLCEVLRSRPNVSLGVQGNSNSGYNQPHPVQSVYNYTSIQNYYFCGHNSSPHHAQHLQATNASPHHVQHQPAASNAIINQRPQRHWKTALDLLNIGVYAGFMSTSFCTIL
ncbi:hypothetical protein R6Q59_030615 [Mikania micrantha]|uniref:EF-hand domain-containing protein n=1 Tax=Mikania micrantha TaxID=192012 RepID=A0A5N6P0K5_9ASTR|nr:hypothetical protein E3N88_16473 [Mikania micrantha]